MAPLVESKSWQKSDKTNKRTNPFVRAQSLDSSQQHEAAKDLAHDRNSDRFGQNLAKQATARQNQPTGNGIQVEDRTDPQKEAEISGQMSSNKQRQLEQIAQKEAQLEKELNELEQNLNTFKKKGPLTTFRFFRPNIISIIEELVSLSKRSVKNLGDEEKAKTLDKLITTTGGLMALLEGTKILTTFLDVLIFHRFSIVRIIIFTLPTIVFPLLTILVSPFFFPLLGTLFFIGKIPLFKGPLTQPVIELIESLKKQRVAWQNQIKTLQKKITIKEQLKKLSATKDKIQGRFSTLIKQALTSN